MSRMPCTARTGDPCIFSGYANGIICAACLLVYFLSLQPWRGIDLHVCLKINSQLLFDRTAFLLCVVCKKWTTIASSELHLLFKPFLFFLSLPVSMQIGFFLFMQRKKVRNTHLKDGIVSSLTRAT